MQEGFNEQREDLFRRKTNRMLREAIAQQYQNIQFTSDRTDKAAKETVNWLYSDYTAICGAVVTHENIRARIPVLIKEKNEITILQIHSKGVKGGTSSVFDRIPPGKSLSRYLLMAAYRCHVLQLAYPDLEIRCRFLFPQNSYQTEIDQLYQKTQGNRNIDKDVLEELMELFASFDGTGTVKKVMDKIPAEVSHTVFRGLSVSEAVEKIQEMEHGEEKNYVDTVHEACRNCAFRRSIKEEESGCWDLHFSDEEVLNGDRHQLDLIGHHVGFNDLQQQMYQEKFSQPKGLNTAEKVMNHTGNKIAIYHRKAMQLLEARNQKLPLVFAKESLNSLKIEYPVHFLDFEAASHAVPFQRGKRPYSPILFQFSCHSLFKNGELRHTQWLDQNPESEIHHELVAALARIPFFSKGTIIQYSPFERQALYKLHREMLSDRSENINEIKILEQFLQSRSAGAGQRFLDLRVVLRDGYYNRFMNNGLSLKQILFAVLNVESSLGTLDKTEYEVEDMTIDLLKMDENGHIVNPYQQISDDRSRIQDGITAMHAYLCLKAGALSEEQSKLVPVLMKRYCTLDTLALHIIFTHLLNIMEFSKSKGDLIIED
ncbi:hypothetical protein BH23BAC3_BH23BAC3_29870 [soil metagenome]